MWQKTVMVATLALLCTGCMTAQDRRAADEAKCRSYGFTKKNDAFAECLQRIDLERRAELRSASAFDSWERPVIYRPVIIRPRPPAEPAAQ
ncbi:conserved exported hypothetical protein [Mesorhizobium metallidurans STM 2683]|uniref:Lipoprotein n=1 Tax=Mesorhizobium metallidurans STM 2683 TaxID=1297569 RepID=M5EUP6_9HYPH|nr:hypothetical protein [Mesorhizobium metallidurans]CCV03406.1 conserved exported hypothetical protein [Mesorhizobium metallidurans STM 2683]